MADVEGNIEKSNISKRPRKNKADEKMAEFIRQEEQHSKDNCSKADSDMQDGGNESSIDMPVQNNNNFGMTSTLT